MTSLIGTEHPKKFLTSNHYQAPEELLRLQNTAVPKKSAQLVSLISGAQP